MCGHSSLCTYRCETLWSQTQPAVSCQAQPATPSPARTRMSRGDGGCNGMDASEAERLPPSPSDPALGQVGFSRGIDVGLGAEASGMVP